MHLQQIGLRVREVCRVDDFACGRMAEFRQASEQSCRADQRFQSRGFHMLLQITPLQREATDCRRNEEKRRRIAFQTEFKF